MGDLAGPRPKTEGDREHHALFPVSLFGWLTSGPARPIPTLMGLALLSCLPYLYALSLGDMREETPSALVAYLAAFVLYWLAVLVILRHESWLGPVAKEGRWQVLLPLAVAALLSLILLFSFPALSDDMFRYVWDGRVQDAGISPYAYPPGAEELAELRDPVVWEHVNRKWAVTIYPPGAEMTWAFLWQLFPDSVLAFKGATVAGGLLAGWLLTRLLRAMGRPPLRALIFLWHPLLIFELAHSGHIDGLVLPLLVGSLLARWRNRDVLVGALLGVATLLKLYPAVLAPILWRPRDRSGRWQLPAAFIAVVALGYLPYLSAGKGVVGFLPRYFGEQFNAGLAQVIHAVARRFTEDTDLVVNGMLFAGLGLISLYSVVRPATTASQAIRRTLWPMGFFVLVTHNLMPWYLLWIIPLVALDLQPGRLLGMRVDATSGWLLFTGLVALSYSFFIDWQTLPWVAWIEYAPLYILLVVGGWRRYREMQG